MQLEDNMRGMAWCAVGAAGSVLCVVIARTIGAFEPDHPELVARFKGQYGFDAWKGVCKTNYSRLVTDWRPPPDVTNRTVGTYSRIDADEEGRGGFMSWCVPNDPEQLVDLHYWEAGSSLAAKEVMVIMLSARNGPPPVLGTSVGIDLGDRCYVCPGLVSNNVAFVRNNVFVCIYAGSTYSVVGIAQRMDEDLLRRSLAQ
jgi:hypothetical protein